MYLIYSLSRGTVVILFLGNICLYFLREITQGSLQRNQSRIEINWGDSTRVSIEINFGECNDMSAKEPASIEMNWRNGFGC